MTTMRCATRFSMKAKTVFKPEFLNRLDEIIVFHHLAKPDLLQIVDLEVDKVLARVKAKDVQLDLLERARRNS